MIRIMKKKIIKLERKMFKMLKYGRNYLKKYINVWNCYKNRSNADKNNTKTLKAR